MTDRLLEVYQRYKHFDKKLSSWVANPEGELVMKVMAGDLWLVIKEEIAKREVAVVE